VVDRHGRWSDRRRACLRRAGASVALLALVGWLAATTFAVLRSVPTAVGPVVPRHSSEPSSPSSSPAASGIEVRAGHIVEADGHDLVLRGINHAYTWFPAENRSFADIKAAGANSVRVLLASGQRWPANTAADVATVVARCRHNRLICVLDVHDTVGLGELGGAATLAQAAEYWISVRHALTGQENYVIINIGDEPYGSDHARTWVADTTAAIHRLRAAGLRHTLMVDAPDWGQDDSFTMRDNAPAVLAADPRADTVFSVHMYGVFTTAARVRTYMASYVRRGLALVVGEFGYLHTYGNPDEDAIMAYAQSDHIGYLGWSWSGNDALVGYLDMVKDFDPGRRTWWGNRFITGPNGLSTTSQEASIYRLPGHRTGG
jgi:mannan endo-1,4-beta-mannosidase